MIELCFLMRPKPKCSEHKISKEDNKIYTQSFKSIANYWYPKLEMTALHVIAFNLRESYYTVAVDLMMSIHSIKASLVLNV